MINGNSATVTLGKYEDRAATGNLSQQEIKDLWNEVQILRRHNSDTLNFIRIVAQSNSQFKSRAQAVLDRIEFGTDDPRVIEAAKKAIEYRKMFTR